MVKATVSTISLARCERFTIKPRSIFSIGYSFARSTTFSILCCSISHDIIADVSAGCTVYWTNRVLAPSCLFVHAGLCKRRKGKADNFVVLYDLLSIDFRLRLRVRNPGYLLNSTYVRSDRNRSVTTKLPCYYPDRLSQRCLKRVKAFHFVGDEYVWVFGFLYI